MSLTKRHFFPEDYAMIDAILEKIKEEEANGIKDSDKKKRETAVA